MKTLPWSPSGVFIAWKESQENEVGLGRGMSPSEYKLPPSSLAYSAHKAGPQSRSPPPSRLMLGKIVSWHNGLEAKPNTLHIPRPCRWRALGGYVCSELTGPPSVGRPLWLAGKTELCTSLCYLLGLICKSGSTLFSRPQFPNLYKGRAKMGQGL